MRWLILLAAILVWVNVYTAVFHTETVPLPIAISGVGEGLAVADPGLAVSATLVGSAHDLHVMTPNAIKFAINLTPDLSAGEHTVPVVLMSHPANISIANFSPKTVTIHLETIVSKTVPIVVTPQGSPADNFHVKSITVDPPTATISGAQSLIAQLSEVHAELSVQKHSTTFTAPVNLFAESGDNHNLDVVTISPATAKVSVEIAQGAAFRTLGLQAAFGGELPGGFWVQEVKFSPSTILVQGTETDLNRLRYLTTTPIQLSGHTKTFTESVAVDLPNGIETVQDNLVSAQVIIVTSADSRQFSLSPQFVNVTDGYSVTSFDPTTVQVVVSGTDQALKDLKASDITLNVDLTGSLSGTNTVKITDSMFVLPPGITLSSFTPDSLNIVLTRQQ